MADLLDYQITPIGGTPLPDFRIEARVVDSETQTHVLADFTGDNALVWPDVLSTLPEDFAAELVAGIAPQIVMKKAGL